MNLVKVKICGITNVSDALNAAACGADAVGFVFYEKSSRFCSIEKAKEISNRLPPFITKVGLFVNAKTDFIEAILNENIIDVIQFHGSESNTFCKAFNCPFIKVISVKNDTNITKISEDFVDASAILLDTFDAANYGGTGKSFDWKQIPAKINKPLIIAGGLNDCNVKELLEHVKPYAVDVSGGVEDAEKGFKSKKLMSSFIKVVKNAEL